MAFIPPSTHLDTIATQIKGLKQTHRKPQNRGGQHSTAKNEEQENGQPSLRHNTELGEHVFPVCLRLDIFQLAEVQEMIWPVCLMVKLLRVGQLQAILHARAVLGALEIVVPAPHIRHHVEAHEPAHRTTQCAQHKLLNLAAVVYTRSMYHKTT